MIALKYHPDRNPGEEDVAKAKFLVIQAAHEILTDDTLKAKYDANRTRSKYPSASGVRGNPYSNVAKDVSEQWGAPPKRQTGAQARPASTRYSSWAPPPQPKPKQDSAYDHLRAWDRMRSAGHRAAAAATSAASAATGKTPRPQPKADTPPPPPRTAYQARQQEASFGTRKTAGFAPTSPLGDEPPVRNQHYANIHTNVFEETAANLRKAKARAADPNVDPLSEQFGETFLDNRQRTPYASHVGEKTNPFEGASTTRAKSARESRKKPHESDDDRTQERPQRQRSASVGESEGMKPTKETPRAGYNAAPNLRFPSQASARYSPRPADPKSAPTTGAFPFPTSTSDTDSAFSSANGTW
jgi:curved DNA-binding protein CbpA